MSRALAEARDFVTGGRVAPSPNRGFPRWPRRCCSVLRMFIRDAIAPVPDRNFAKRVAIATGVSTALIMVGAVVALAHVPIHDDYPHPLVEDPPERAIATPEEIATAKLELRTYAYETYPAWVASHGDRECPARLLDLNRYNPQLHAVDPWGTPYQFLCGKQFEITGVHTRSAGPDRRFDTPDDLTP